MLHRRQTYTLAAISLSVMLGLGCSGGGGCGLTPLPKNPGPVGLPFDQQIEGGMQVRITKPGFEKLTSVIGPLISKQFSAAPTCAFGHGQQDFVIGTVDWCSMDCNGNQACPVNIALNGNLAPPSGVQLSMRDDPSKAVLHMKIAFDAHVPVDIRGKAFFTGWSYICHPLNLDAPGTVIDADIRLDTDPTTGQLTIKLENINKVVVHFGASGCGVLSAVLNAVLGIADAIINSFVGQFIINFLQGPFNTLIQGFLPHPPGMAGVIPTGKTLANLGAPPDAALETYLVAGGYVSAFGGGLNLGVITGMNSDRDPTTRTPGLTSEPSLCVPIRPTASLTGPPWNLPMNTKGRPDVALAPAAEFSGMPDPVDAQTGKTQDIALGLSRGFLNLAGFHLFNSGTLCLAISGDTLAQLNAGALTVLVPSLGNIVENRKAPLAIALRPEQPLTFTIGAGTMMDPLLHIHVDDLRVDFYAFIEERYVRVFTLSTTMEVKIDLVLTKDKDGNPALQPMITGIDKKSVQLKVLNADLTQEDPAKLAKTLAGLIDIAANQLMGSIKPFTLPALMGFSLDGLSITRVQTAQDDFVAIYGSIVNGRGGPGGGGEGFPEPGEWVAWPHTSPMVKTVAEVLDVSVPPGDVIVEALAHDSHDPGELPSVTLRLAGWGHATNELEWQERVDGGGWNHWSDNKQPTITSASFLLQGHHQVEVRSRLRGDWASEDSEPVKLDVLIDSVAPTMKPALEGGVAGGLAGASQDAGRLVLHGEDNVSDASALRYAWKTASGWTPFTTQDSLTVSELFALTHDGQDKLTMAAIDEAGNRGELAFDASGLYTAFHGRTTTPSTGGCGCAVAGRQDSGGLTLALFALLPFAGLLLRRKKVSARLVLLVGLVAAGAVGTNLGCSCSSSTQKGCFVPDDCRLTKCMNGEVPICLQGGMCACNPDTPLGDVGRFASLGMRGGVAYVAAYNNSYGDLMIGHIIPPGVVNNWEFVDGVPEDAPSDNPLSSVRGGVTEKGDDVGRYASLVITAHGDPVIAYYDSTHGALKYGSFGAVRWHSMVVDKGLGSPTAGGDDFGRFCSLTLAKDGTPGIAYYAEVSKGASGMRESQLRFAQAHSPDPQKGSDWTVTTVETRPMPVVPMSGAPSQILPNGIALMTASARKADDGPVVAYYDRERGNLRYVEFDNGGKKWGTPLILDGEDGQGNDTGDVGQYPAVVSDGNTSHISYVDATRDNLLYVDTKDKTPEVVDDGYRPKDEMTNDGLPAPVYHLVGDSSSLQLAGGTGGAPILAYQDSTVEQLRFGVRDPATKKWTLTTVAGHGSPFKGSYGFYAQARVSGGVAVLSTYAINQHLDSPSFYVETFAINLGGIM